MLTIRTKENLNRFIKRLDRRSTFQRKIEATVRKILKEVLSKGDTSLVKYNELFDKHTLPLKVNIEEIKESSKKVSKDVYDAINFAALRIRKFHEKQLESSWQYEEGDITLGQIIRPLERVGAYVPGGKASYPSTVLMNIIPAQVAGVREIAVCVPTPEGELNPVVCAALDILGIKEIYRVGGAQAVAAMAYGTETIKRVDKIVGPGNIFVALAKRLVFGVVDIDMIAGPSEILIIADNSAIPSFVAADMLSQAEHDEMACSVLVTTSEKLALSVKKEIVKQLRQLPKSSIAEKSLKKFGAIVIVNSISEACEVANIIAPEHLEIMTEKPREILPFIKNAGAIFLGQWTPEPIGDYVAGPNHTLPTTGTARFFSPLGVYDFIKRSSLIEVGRDSFLKFASYVDLLANVEGLQAHANTIKIRKDFYE
ncbi:histidinol dehydrogenase [Thermodesulfovibrio sp.]|uniref:histidinol dehydrogenase n=1 Tax=Thermodesulfovibrio sp. TaxID=2067987 RepID=UPI0030A4F19C